MNTHRLKTLPQYWDAIKAGTKRFEIRWDDRGYMEGDTLELVRYDPESEAKSGQILQARVGYIFRPGADADYGITRGYVVMSIDPISPPDLTAAQIERLAVLVEEHAEVIMAAAKTLRHGYDSYNPDKRHAGNNKSMLETEIGHAHAAAIMMIDHWDISGAAVRSGRREKEGRPSQYLHHQPDRE